MTSINVDEKVKERFNQLQPNGKTQSEFVKTLLDAYEQHGDGVDPDEWADRVAEEITEDVATKVEIGAFRGAKEAVER